MSKILLAEDEKAMSMAVQAILTHQGHEVDLAANGQEAVDKASKNLYDCMVFDIMMPVKDGITALEEIRATGDTTPVIMLTAKAEVDDKILGLDAGADDYLTKPFAMGELLARIRSLTRRQSEFNPEKTNCWVRDPKLREGELSSRSAVRLSPKNPADAVPDGPCGKALSHPAAAGARVARRKAGRSGDCVDLHFLSAGKTEGHWGQFGN